MDTINTFKTFTPLILYYKGDYPTMTDKTKDEISEDLKQKTRQAENLDELGEVVEEAINRVKEYSDEYDE